MDSNQHNMLIPYIAYESALSRMERIIKRQWITIFALIAAIICSIGAFIWYIGQYDYESYEITQDSSGVNIVGDSNGVKFIGTDRENKEAN